MKKKVVKKKSCLSVSMKAEIKQLMLEVISESLEELRKPKIDPRVKEEQEKQRQTMKAQQARIAAYKKAEQDKCKHLQGCNPLSDRSGALTSIVWHFFDDGVLRGICTNCQRWFLPEDSDYTYWKSQQTGNFPSAAGNRVPGPFSGLFLPSGFGEPVFNKEMTAYQFNDLGCTFKTGGKINDDSLDPNDWSDQKLKDHINELKTQSGK